MLPSLPEEHIIGIDHFISNHDGVGGSLRNSPENFQVYEIDFHNNNIALNFLSFLLGKKIFHLVDQEMN